MHRDYLFQQLNSYKNYWIENPKSYANFSANEEIANLTRITNFVKDEPNCFKRSLLKGHITGSALVTNKSFDKVLLTLHAKLKIWLL